MLSAIQKYTAAAEKKESFLYQEIYNEDVVLNVAFI